MHAHHQCPDFLTNFSVPFSIHSRTRFHFVSLQIFSVFIFSFHFSVHSISTWNLLSLVVRLMEVETLNVLESTRCGIVHVTKDFSSFCFIIGFLYFFFFFYLFSFSISSHYFYSLCFWPMFPMLSSSFVVSTIFCCRLLLNSFFIALISLRRLCRSAFAHTYLLYYFASFFFFYILLLFSAFCVAQQNRCTGKIGKN